MATLRRIAGGLRALVRRRAEERERVNWGGSWATIIGVVGDVRQFGLDAPAAPEVYISFDQGPPSNPLLVIRSANGPASLAAAFRRPIRSPS